MEQRAERRRQRRRRQRGFTLVELLVVLAILALIATVVTPQVIQYLGSANTKAAQLQVGTLSATLDLYRIEVGDYPAETFGL